MITNATLPGFATLWPHLIEIDGNDRLNNRANQKSFLARYGRADWLAWGDADTTELDDAYMGVLALVERENALSRMNEDR